MKKIIINEGKEDRGKEKFLTKCPSLPRHLRENEARGRHVAPLFPIAAMRAIK